MPSESIPNLPDIDVERITQGLIRTRAAAERAGKLGWTLPLFSTPRDFVELVEGIADADIERSFESFYDVNNGENLSALADELLREPRLEQWRSLLAESVEAYRAGLYRVVIPALLTVCEGVAVASAGAEAAKDRSPTPAIEKRLESIGMNLDGSLTQAIVISIREFGANAFGYADFEAARPATLNRHWILHGRDNPVEWRKVDALRLLQAVHTFTALFTSAPIDDNEHRESRD